MNDHTKQLRQIGERVAYFRRQHHWTQQELADRIHRSLSTVSRIERGGYKGSLPLHVLMDMAEVMQISLAQLFLSEDVLLISKKGV